MPMRWLRGGVARDAAAGAASAVAVSALRTLELPVLDERLDAGVRSSLHSSNGGAAYCKYSSDGLNPPSDLASFMQR